MPVIAASPSAEDITSRNMFEQYRSSEQHADGTNWLARLDGATENARPENAGLENDGPC